MMQILLCYVLNVSQVPFADEPTKRTSIKWQTGGICRKMRKLFYSTSWWLVTVHLLILKKTKDKVTVLCCQSHFSASIHENKTWQEIGTLPSISVQVSLTRSILTLNQQYRETGINICRYLNFSPLLI